MHNEANAVDHRQGSPLLIQDDPPMNFVIALQPIVILGARAEEPTSLFDGRRLIPDQTMHATIRESSPERNGSVPAARKVIAMAPQCLVDHRSHQLDTHMDEIVA